MKILISSDGLSREALLTMLGSATRRRDLLDSLADSVVAWVNNSLAFTSGMKWDIDRAVILGADEVSSLAIDTMESIEETIIKCYEIVLEDADLLN